MPTLTDHVNGSHYCGAMSAETPWWPGPLDVGRLARVAVQAAVLAATRVARGRSQDIDVTTSPELVLGAFSALETLTVDGRPSEAFAPLSGFFPTVDGWVRLHGNYPHHAEAIVTVTGATNRSTVREALSTWSAGDVERDITAAGGIAVQVRTPQEWQSHPQAQSPPSWLSTTILGERGRLVGGTLPLDSVRVLDLTRVIAGPTCTQLLGCLGADVLRIDPPDRPELREQYLSNGMGKRSAAVDLGTSPDVLEPLLRGADVVVLGYRPGSLDRFGLAPHALTRRHPHLVVASLSAWGETGPWGSRAGFDSIVQAATGIATISTDPARRDGPPGALPVQALDHSTGYAMAAVVMELLAARRAGIIRATLLGAAQMLLCYDRIPFSAGRDMATSAVTVPSPDGPLVVAPPALLLNGDTIERPVHPYGSATPMWTT